MASPQAHKPEPQPDSSKFARHFNRAVTCARLSGLAERAWDRAAPTVGGLTATFLTASWLGLWQNVTPSVRMAGVVLFAAALASAVAPLRKIRMPSRDDAIARLDKNTGLPDRPAATYDDIPSQESAHKEHDLIWDIQRNRIEKKVGKFKAGAPRSGLKARAPSFVRYALPVAMALSFGAAYSEGEEVERIAKAFDWKLETIVNDAQIDAWVTPPDYTGEEPVYLSTRKDGLAPLEGGRVSVPAGSILTLRVHDRNARIAMEGGATPVEDACAVSERDKVTRCAFALASTAGITIERRNGDVIQWNINVTPDRPPIVSVAPQGEEGEQGPDLTYTIKDEYGADVTEGRIRPLEKPADPGATPLPVYNLPKITVPQR